MTTTVALWKSPDDLWHWSCVLRGVGAELSDSGAPVLKSRAEAVVAADKACGALGVVIEGLNGAKHKGT